LFWFEYISSNKVLKFSIIGTTFLSHSKKYNMMDRRKKSFSNIKNF